MNEYISIYETPYIFNCRCQLAVTPQLKIRDAIAKKTQYQHVLNKGHVLNMFVLNATLIMTRRDASVSEQDCGNTGL